MRPVVIVGGGISGLSTAYYLSKAGIQSMIVEAQPVLGGLIQTETHSGCTVELGPDSFLTAKSAARDLCREIGLGSELIGCNESNRGTYIWRGGRLRRMPEGMTMMVPARIGPLLSSDLLSWPGKMRAGFDLLRRPAGQERDRSVSEFVSDHYGREVLDYIAEPMLAGVYGGDPATMSIQSVVPKFTAWEAKYGSLTRAARAEIKPSGEPLFTSLRGGLHTLITRLAELANPELIHGRVERVEKGWRVRVGGEWLESERLIVACRVSTVIPDLFPAIPYNSARVIVVAYRRSDLAMPLTGFGFLVPRVERRAVSACTFVPNKFDHRAPDDIVLLRLFTGGPKADIRAEIAEKLGIRADPLFVREIEWPESMPQYEVGHSQKVKIIEQMLGDFPGLHLVGNAYNGVGIPDCIRMAKEVAARITSGRSGE